MNEQYTPGQSVFSRDGQKHYVREILDDQRLLTSPWLISTGYQGDEEEYVADNAQIKLTSEMFSSAPTAVVDGDVAKAQADLAELRSAISAARSEAAAVERERKETLAKIEKAPKFSRLLDFIDGKITHFVVGGYHSLVSIQTWEQFAISQDDHRDKDVKLLTLFGRSNGDTEWRLNPYYDGPGGWVTCRPCCSYEEALAVLGETLEGIWLEFDDRRSWTIAGAIKAADEYGKLVPQHIRAAFKQHQIESHQRAVDKAEADLAAAKERMSAALAKEPHP